MNNNKIKDLIIKIILIIIIIILLLHNCYIMNKAKNEKQPTGNVDIFEIKCDKEECKVETNEPVEQKPEISDDDANKINEITDIKPVNKEQQTDPKKETDKKDGKKEENSNNEKPQDDNKEEPTTPDTPTEPDTPITPTEPDAPIEPENPEEPEIIEEPDPEELLVKDKEKTWNENTTARIFSNSMYELGDKIAPESSNTYQFIVKNGTEYNLKYNIEFIENNPYNINMKYKLKKNDTYLIDHYVSASELIIEEFLLDAKTSDTYYLEWKWISSDNDTEIGTTENAMYELKIDIKAESYNE